MYAYVPDDNLFGEMVNRPQNHRVRDVDVQLDYVCILDIYAYA